MCSNAVIFSTDGKFCPVSNFTELHALTLAACSYAVLFIERRGFHVNFLLFLLVGIVLMDVLLTAVAK